MATMKSFTDLEQSKKLAGILPLESADMYYWCADHYPKEDWIIEVGMPDDNYKCICAWSLAALLNIASTYCNRLEITLRTNKKYNVFVVKGDFVFRSFDKFPNGIDNLVDTCVELVLKLNELNLL